ncbi:MAG: ABC transporter ATP-binding protein, partial [Erysipelotrichia bacterium]|nr:ABC transporter ATP-binding protein [Erysipelotrichia bacterium]
MQRTENHLMNVLKRILHAHPWMILITLLAIAGAVATALFPPLVLESVINDLSSSKAIALSAALLY